MKNSLFMLLLISASLGATELNPVENIVPKKPSDDEAFKSLVGVDSDKDGVRDDFERIIHDFNYLRKYPLLRKAFYNSVFWDSQMVSACKEKIKTEKCIETVNIAQSSLICITSEKEKSGIKGYPSGMIKLGEELSNHLGKSLELSKLKRQIIDETALDRALKYKPSEQKCIYGIKLKEEE